VHFKTFNSSLPHDLQLRDFALVTELPLKRSVSVGLVSIFEVYILIRF
jgi:hypothetical protein